MAHDVFVSHASEDRSVADSICAALEEQGMRCWIAHRDIRAGALYAEAIETAVSAARLLVVVFSQHAVVSSGVLNEINLANDKSLIVISFRIENAPLVKGLNYYLGRHHWLEASKPPSSQQLAALAQSVREHLQVDAVPRPPERSTNPEAQAAHNRGTEFHHREEFDLAIAEYTRAIELDPTIAWAFIDRGVAQLRKGNLDAALSDLNQGIRLDPSHAWPHHDRATIYLRRNEMAEAIKGYTAALQIDPTMAWSYHDRGAAHLKLGHYTEAIADSTEAIRLNPKLEWAYRHRADAYKALGTTELAQDDLAVAEEIEAGRGASPSAHVKPTAPNPSENAADIPETAFQKDDHSLGIGVKVTEVQQELVAITIKLESVGSKYQCEVPVDASVESLIRQLTEMLKLPRIEVGGRTVAWDLYSKFRGQKLDPSKTLRENHVPPGDTLTFCRWEVAG